MFTLVKRWAGWEEPTEEAPRAYLICEFREGDGCHIELGAAPLTIGRAPEVDLQLNDTQVSRLHCDIHLVKGRYWIKDLASRNGTWVNEQRVRESPLCLGDWIRLGNVFLRFSLTPQGQPLRPGEASEASSMHNVTSPLPVSPAPELPAPVP